MNPKTGVQLIAAFMILSMVLSSVAYFLGSDGSNGQNNDLVNDIQPDTFNVQGQQIFESFTSIEDALRMSTPGTTGAQFVDVEHIQTTGFQLWNELIPGNLTTVKRLNKVDVDNLYSSSTNMISTRQMYYAQLPSDDFILMSSMTPKRVTFQYIGLLSNTTQYLLLQRTDTGGTNVMGEPTIYTTSREKAEAVLAILDNWTIPITAYDTFRPVLNYSDDYSEFQAVNSQVDFADLYYMGMHMNDDGSFTRTTIYQNPDSRTSSHINDLARTGLDRGFVRYDVTRDGDILKVALTGDFSMVTTEDIQ